MMLALPSERTLGGERSKAYAIVYNDLARVVETESIVFSILCALCQEVAYSLCVAFMTCICLLAKRIFLLHWICAARERLA